MLLHAIIYIEGHFCLINYKIVKKLSVKIKSLFNLFFIFENAFCPI